MKNWNDAGTVHYDAETNQRYTEKTISFEHRGRRRIFRFAIPLKMTSALKLEHYDQAITLAMRVIDQQLLNCWRAGEFDRETNNRTAERMAWGAMLEHLYNVFHLVQAQAGNQVWATPERMQDVGPRPEDDPKIMN